MYSRTQPYIARIKERTLLTKPGSTKRTYHVALESEIPFKVGDSIGVLPTNDLKTVEQIIHKLHATGNEEIFDTAFSRDQAEKIYVQHKLLEYKKAIWEWIQAESYIYVCGDADQMAKDVDAALQQIIQTQGNMGEEDARKFIKALLLEKRYLLDVY